MDFSSSYQSPLFFFLPFVFSNTLGYVKLLKRKSDGWGAKSKGKKRDGDDDDDKKKKTKKRKDDGSDDDDDDDDDDDKKKKKKGAVSTYKGVGKLPDPLPVAEIKKQVRKIRMKPN